ncbi:hypothetical protein LUZ60_005517 [Juncus effusus]|nr:hypothetical protein LUZ60_005517 [Juncus effusus]
MASMVVGSKVGVFHLHGNTWKCRTELESDVVIEIQDFSFFLHKFPLINTSCLLEKLITKSHSDDETICTVTLTDIPGGSKSFELIAKFCYGEKIELNASNVVPLRCAAEYFRMTEDYIKGNLISQTENFLTTKILTNWDDSVKALTTCESVLNYAEELDIVSRCIKSLATKAISGKPTYDPSLVGEVSWNGITCTDTPKLIGSDWWYEDVSALSLSLFKRLIRVLDSKGMNPENLANAVIYYASTYNPGLNPDSTGIWSVDQRVLLEEIVGLFPIQKGVTSTKFLFSMLSTSIMLNATPACIESLEKRIGAQLDESTLEDLLVPNLGGANETVYDIDCIQRIIEQFMLENQHESEISQDSNSGEEGSSVETSSALSSKIATIAKLVDGYLVEIAADANLKLHKFQLLASVIPSYARPFDDVIYHAIDVYLEFHSWLTEAEKEQLCHLINIQKLSVDARKHAAQNKKLPLRVVVNVLFVEQLHLKASFSECAIVNGHGDLFENGTANENDLRKRCLELQKEYLTMKKQISTLAKPKNKDVAKKWGFFNKLFETTAMKTLPTQNGKTSAVKALPAPNGN